MSSRYFNHPKEGFMSIFNKSIYFHQIYNFIKSHKELWFIKKHFAMVVPSQDFLPFPTRCPHGLVEVHSWDSSNDDHMDKLSED